mmetsp:Transcript_9869/g.15434  ORF Transcript_9869/g.15434 Transcript_9869/m.15434 type:complete len:105 (+) Transcript_9869:349-663(+)
MLEIDEAEIGAEGQQCSLLSVSKEDRTRLEQPGAETMDLSESTSLRLPLHVLEQRAMLRGLASKFVTPVSSPAWLNRPIKVKVSGGVFKCTIPIDALPTSFEHE